jgi:hypothetical protein
MRLRVAVRSLPLLALASLVAACYDSPVPLGPPDQPIDTALVGTWTCVDPKDAANHATLTSRRLDAHRYDVEWRESRTHLTRYRVHATAIGAERLFNVQEVDPQHPDKAFGFLKVTLGSNRALTIAVVEADAVKPLTGAEAIRAITSRVGDPALYGPFAACTATGGKKK